MSEKKWIKIIEAATAIAVAVIPEIVKLIGKKA